jgi:Leucine-rich repeat (LRR) protein
MGFEKGQIVMNIKKVFSVMLAFGTAMSLSGCSLFGGDSESAEASPDESELLSQIESLQNDVSSLKEQTMANISYRSKSDYILGKDNPAVSEAAAEKEKVMADLPATIMIKGTEYSTDLTSLTLSNMDLTDDDIKELKYMVNLTELQIYQNNITDLSPLKGLTSLKNLSLFKNQISDLTPIAGLANLESLYLRANNITDISPLDGLTNLTALDLSENNIEDITPLAELRNLTMLRLNDNNISSITALGGMSAMERLHLQNNNISDITPVMEMVDLDELYIQNNNVSSIEPIMSLTSIEWLRVSDNPITNMRPAATLTALKKLYMENISVDDETMEYLTEQLPDTTFVT